MRFLAVVALLVLSVGGCWFATQYVASALAYAPALGTPWATLGDERLYAPWQWIVWGRLYAPRAPIVFRNAGAMTSLAALAGAGRPRWRRCAASLQPVAAHTVARAGRRPRR